MSKNKANNQANEQKGAKMFLPAAIIVTSFYYSILLAGGIIAGYIFSKLFCKLFIESGKINPVLVDYGRWTLHLHHWITGTMILLAVWMVDGLYLPIFFTGIILGAIVQDIYDYNDWHKVITKNDNNSKKQSAIL